MEFKQRIHIASPAEHVWDLLWDVSRLAACIPGCSDVRPTDNGTRYLAVVGERLGPFEVRFQLDLTIVEVEEGKRVRLVAQGRDVRVASQIKIDLDVSLNSLEDGEAVLDIASDVNVFGKLGSLGHGVIKRRGEEIINQFAVAVKAQVEGRQQEGEVPA